MSRSRLVAITRSEAATRGAKFARLTPVTHAFELPLFRESVEEEAQRLAAACKGAATAEDALRNHAVHNFRIVGQAKVHVLPVDRNSPRSVFSALKGPWKTPVVPKKGGAPQQPKPRNLPLGCS
ncbi:hypothetical protein DIPPA_24532 [Diplonema papillatum]|nr:hypothetical protein DIPPA_24532 [Diplonema papillatum]